MQYRALFIGLTTIDIQYFVESFPVSNIKVKTKIPDILVGGPATNAAVAFAKLNNGTFLATASGKNAFTSFIIDDFVNTQITHFDLAKHQTINPVIASVITSSKNGDRNIFTHNPELQNYDYSAKELFETIHPEIILLDGFYPEFALECAKIAKEKNIPVVMDCGSWKQQYIDLLNFTNIAICSADFYPPDCTNTEQVLKYLQNKKIKKIAISRGEENLIFSDEKRGEVLVENANVVDTLGAGDFLHGAFCYHFLESGQFELALKNASEFATFSCQFEGTRKWLKMI